MGILDIHSHILPNVDDGATDMEMALALLGQMKRQGITDVIATPHFYADEIGIKEFKDAVNASAAALKSSAEQLPEIYIGAEVLYFKGIGYADIVDELTLGGSEYLLLELGGGPIGKYVIDDILALVDCGIVPILAHIERYAHCSGFKGILNMIEDELVLSQINAESLTHSPYYRTAVRLIKKGYVTFVATDTHDIVGRPPRMKAALDEVERLFGTKQRDIFIHNSIKLLEEISQRGKSYAE